MRGFIRDGELRGHFSFEKRPAAPSRIEQRGKRLRRSDWYGARVTQRGKQRRFNACVPELRPSHFDPGAAELGEPEIRVRPRPGGGLETGKGEQSGRDKPRVGVMGHAEMTRGGGKVTPRQEGTAHEIPVGRRAGGRRYGAEKFDALIRRPLPAAQRCRKRAALPGDSQPLDDPEQQRRGDQRRQEQPPHSADLYRISRTFRSGRRFARATFQAAQGQGPTFS